MKWVITFLPIYFSMFYVIYKCFFIILLNYVCVYFITLLNYNNFRENNIS